MKGIYFKDGVYVLIETEEDESEINEYLILCPEERGEANYIELYGGRIKLRWYYDHDSTISVDGIRINNSTNFVNYSLNYSTLISHLNAIETNGVEAFLEHYKQSIEMYKEELIKQQQRIESILSNNIDSKEIKTILDEFISIFKSINNIIGILFSISTIMSAGLDNEKVNSVYQSIVDSLS